MEQQVRTRIQGFIVDNYLFGDAASNLTAEQRQQVEEKVRHEMLEIFYARNMPR